MELKALCPDSTLCFLYLFWSCRTLIPSAEEVVNLASRRLSVSPSCASSNSHRNYSFRRGSVWSVRSLASAEGEKIKKLSDDKNRKIKPELIFHFLLLCPDEENTTEHTPTHHMLQPPQAVFPACICAAVLPIVHLMEDGEVREDGVAGRSLYTVSDPTQITQLLKKLLYHLDISPPCGWTLGLFSLASLGFHTFCICTYTYCLQCFLSECCRPTNPLELLD